MKWQSYQNNNLQQSSFIDLNVAWPCPHWWRFNCKLQLNSQQFGKKNSKDFVQHLREILLSEMVFYFLLAAFTNHWHKCVDSVENIHCQK